MSTPSSSSGISSATVLAHHTAPGSDQPVAAAALASASASAQGAADAGPGTGTTSSPDTVNRYGTRRKQPLSVHIPSTMESGCSGPATAVDGAAGGTVVPSTGNSVGIPQTSPRPRSHSTGKDRKRKSPRSASDLAGSSHPRSSSVAADIGDAIYYPQTRNGSYSGAVSGHKQLPAQLCHRILNGLLLHGRLSMQSIMTLLPELGTTSSQRDHATGILEVLEVLGLVQCLRVDDTDATRRLKRKKGGGSGSTKTAKQLQAEAEEAVLTEEQKEARQATHEQELLDAQAQAHAKAHALAQAQQQHIAQSAAQSAALVQAQGMRIQQIDQVYAQLAQLEELGRQGHPGQTPPEVEIRVNHIAKLHVWIQQANTQKDAGAAQIAAHTHQTAAKTAAYAHQIAQQAAQVTAATAAARENVLAQTLAAKHTPDCHYVLTGYAKCNTDVPFLSKDIKATIEAKVASAAAITARTQALMKLSNEISTHSSESSSILQQKRSKGANAKKSKGDSSPSTDGPGKASRVAGGSTHYKHKQDRLSKLRALVTGFIDNDPTLQDDSIYRALVEGGLDIAASGRVR